MAGKSADAERISSRQELAVSGKCESMMRWLSLCLEGRGRNVGRKEWMVVVYWELSKRDGFVITAYLLSKRPKGEVVWRP